MVMSQNSFATTYYNPFLLDKECTGSNGEQCTTLDESRGKNHVCHNLTRSLRLTGNGVHCAAADFTNTKTCTDSCNACSKTAAQLCQTLSSQK